MTRPTYTIEQILALRPCPAYRDDNAAHLRALFGGREHVTALDVATDERASPADRRWLVARLLGRVGRILWAAECAEAVIGLVKYERTREHVAETIAAARACAADPSTENRQRARNADADAADANAYAAVAAWRGEDGDADAAHEYRLSAVMLAHIAGSGPLGVELAVELDAQDPQGPRKEQ